MDEKDQPYTPQNPQPPARTEQKSPQPESQPKANPAGQNSPLPSHQGLSKRNSKLLTAGAVLIVVAVAGGSYLLFIRDKNGPATPASSQGSGQPGSSTEVSSQITASTKTHNSTKQRLSFDYPQDWTAVEDTGLIKVTSPAIKLTDTSGQNKTGQIVLQVRNKTAALPEFDGGSATAALTSQKVKYSKPTEVQRGETYVSFLHYAGSAEPGIDGIYVTGNFGYKAGQYIAKADFASADPKITITFNQCADSNCLQNPIKLTLAKTSWDNSAFSTSLLNIIKSFAIN